MTKVTAKKVSRTKTTPYDVAEHLRSPEEMAAYLDAWLEEAPDDAAGIAKALGDLARAKGMTQVAKDAGLSRESSLPRTQRWRESKLHHGAQGSPRPGRKASRRGSVARGAPEALSTTKAPSVSEARFAAAGRLLC